VTVFRILAPRTAALIAALVLAGALFALGGCSTLGIATTDQMDGVAAWQDSVGRVLAATSAQSSNNNARLADLDSVEARLERVEEDSQATLDTLQVRMERARAWAESLELDRLANDARGAEAAAASAARRSEIFTESYLSHLISQRKALQVQIDQILTMMDSVRTLEGEQTPQPPAPAEPETDATATEGE
jgi:hypothetical protein